MTADVHKSPDTASDLQTRPPGIWLVMGDKLGDNAQLKLVAASLGLPYEIKRLYPREKYRLGKPRFRASLDHLDPDRSDSPAILWRNLAWPDS